MIYQPREDEMLDKKYFRFREEVLNENKILDRIPWRDCNS